MKGSALWIVLLSLMVLGGCNDLESLEEHGKQTESNVVEQTQVAKKDLVIKPRWHKVTSFQGEGPKETPPFKIKGKEWKISWETRPVKENGEFIVILYDEKNPEVSEVIANTTGEGKDLVYLEGKGTYYLSINTNQSYTITVEELK